MNQTLSRHEITLLTRIGKAAIRNRYKLNIFVLTRDELSTLEKPELYGLPLCVLWTESFQLKDNQTDRKGALAESYFAFKNRKKCPGICASDYLSISCEMSNLCRVEI